MMKRWLQRLGVLALFMGLMACAGTGSGSGRTDGGGVLQAQGRDYFPGGHPSYRFGISQGKETFANIEHAQWNYSLNNQQRSWTNIEVTEVRATAQIIGLYAYYPLHVRWKLKDGREFILEGADLRPMMSEYFKSHDIKLQWQREGRPKADGDYLPLLAIEIKGDAVAVKWMVTINDTPYNQRFTATGVTLPWKFRHEEYLVTTLIGSETSGLDFTKWHEICDPGDKR